MKRLEDYFFYIFSGTLLLAICVAVFYGVSDLVKSVKQDNSRLMQECMKDYKEYQCVSILRGGFRK